MRRCNDEETPIIPQRTIMPQMMAPFSPWQTGSPYDYSLPAEVNQVDPTPPVMQDSLYLQGYLESVKGKYIRVDFLLGTGTFVDKEGVLVDVGVDHIVLREPETDNLLVADLYSIKFVTVYESKKRR